MHCFCIVLFCIVFAFSSPYCFVVVLIWTETDFSQSPVSFPKVSEDFQKFSEQLNISDHFLKFSDDFQGRSEHVSIVHVGQGLSACLTFNII